MELKAAVEKRVTLVADMEVITHDHYEDDEDDENHVTPDDDEDDENYENQVILATNMDVIACVLKMMNKLHPFSGGTGFYD